MFRVCLYPRLKFIENGEPVEYNISRSKVYYVKWLKEKIEKADINLIADKGSKHIKETHIHID